MEGVSGKEYVAGVRNSEGISSSGIASIFLVVRGASDNVMMWVDQSLMDMFALVYTPHTQDM